jgi:hypothetical protein
MHAVKGTTAARFAPRIVCQISSRSVLRPANHSNTALIAIPVDKTHVRRKYVPGYS